MGDTQRMLHPRANAQRLHRHIKASVGYACGLLDNYRVYHPECGDEIEELESLLVRLRTVAEQASWLGDQTDSTFKKW